MPRETGLRVFESFPEIRNLGRDRLQSLCDDWRATPVAREFAVSALTVDDSARVGFVVQLRAKPSD